MFYLDYHVSTQMCRLWDAFMCMFAHYKTSVCTLFWLTKSCLCVTFIQLLTHETMSENIGFTDSKDSVHCKKTCLYTTFWLTCPCACANFSTRTDVCVQFEHNFPLLRLMRRVYTSCINCETWQCAIFHQKMLFCTILTYKDVYRCKLSHRRTCLYATCDIIFYVLSWLPCIHAVCRLPDEFMRVFTH